MISMPISGALSDRVGRRPMILISLAGSTLGFLLQGFATSLGFFIGARIVAGMYVSLGLRLRLELPACTSLRIFDGRPEGPRLTYNLHSHSCILPLLPPRPPPPCHFTSKNHYIVRTGNLSRLKTQIPQSLTHALETHTYPFAVGSAARSPSHRPTSPT